jgi:Raf kinase inhibitor-like YbhB/YbcL family protein
VTGSATASRLRLHAPAFFTLFGIRDKFSIMDLHRIWSFSCCAFLLTGLSGLARPVTTVNISSPAFAQGKPIPARYVYKGQNIFPELRIENGPANARSLVLIVDDPDSPSGLWTHWLVWNLPANTTSIPEGKLPSGAIQGKNSFGNARYDGPAPPSGTHRYFFRIYALDATLSLSAGSNRAALVAAMNGHVVGAGETFGLYSASP